MTYPDPTTGALGSIYSSLGAMTLGEVYDGRVVNAEWEIQATVTRSIDTTFGIGNTFDRTIPNVLSVSRPPSRTIPNALAVYFTRDRAIPNVLATQFHRDRVIPNVLAASVVRTRVIPNYLAVSRVTSPALLAPRRGGLMETILGSLNPLYDRDPQAVTMLTVGPGGATVAGLPWRVTGNLFEIVGLPTVTPATPTGALPPTIPGQTDALVSGVPGPQGFVSTAHGAPVPGTGIAPYTRDLRTLTIGQLATELVENGYSATADPAYDQLAATTLVDGHGDGIQVGGADIGGYLSPLWQFLRAMALGFELLQDDMAALAAQLDLRRAGGIWLDWWGELYHVPRLAPEDDDRYRKRIIWSVTRPRSNNTAIEAILRDLYETDVYVNDEYPLGVSRGNPADPSIIDRTYSPNQALMGSYHPGYPPRFVVAVPSDTDPATVAQMAQVVETLRAAGVRYRIAFFDVPTRWIAAEFEIAFPPADWSFGSEIEIAP